LVVYQAVAAVAAASLAVPVAVAVLQELLLALVTIKELAAAVPVVLHTQVV
jgi:hypothetical protein